MTTDAFGVPLLSVRGLTKVFPVRAGHHKKMVPVVEGVSFDIMGGESLGLVGESGCGKTTVGRTIVGLYERDGGEVLLHGKKTSKSGDKALSKSVQMVFQDPYTSLDPRQTIADILAEPLRLQKVAPKSQWRRLAGEAVERVGLEADCLDRYPFSLSGGQRQRIAIARALISNPSLVICDEAVSALDVSVQAQVLNMLAELQAQTGVAYLFISHDLAVVRHLCTRIVVMYLGHIVEAASTDELFSQPLHPYVEALLSAVPEPDPRRARSKHRIVLEGELPALTSLPRGCIFCTRCPYATERCRQERPELQEHRPGHLCACLRADELQLVGA
ncbi:oligopeptide transport system ATP-binding protein [Olsenella sp. KH3B4]|uniref:ABC transporter ATP-binding protein n=1 Tax=Olsenella sp. KH3B4 TaxID=1855394 RepID=UPI0008D61497|nr:oligopeptide/dipeptide ABC transporter ATP-binding protein [Olsenella sp. KH3B4]SES99956.1 oligopeptide transport system ATP-binding protein [Olsenella sp. KH3B4]